MTIGIEQFRDRASSGSIACCFSPFVATPAAIRSDTGRLNDERVALVATTYTPAAARRSCRAGPHFIATRSILRRLILGLARLAWGADRLCGALRPRDSRFRSRRALSRSLAVRCLDRSGEPSGTLRGPRLARPLPSWSRATSLGDWVGRKAGGLLKRLIDGVDAEGWRFVAFVRLVPLFPFNLSNYVSVSLAYRFIITCSPRSSAWHPAQLPTPGWATPDAGR